MAKTGELRVPTDEEVARLSPADRARMAAAYLKGLETTSKLHRELFVEVARLMVLSTVELVPLRTNTNTGNVEALLTQRPADDPWWAGQWHVPGTVISPTDEVSHDDDIDFDDPKFDPIATYRTPIDRIVKGELQDGIRIVDKLWPLIARYRTGIRGHESTVMLWTEVEVAEGPQPPVGQFFEATNISQNPPAGGLIVGHGFLIECAAAAYNALRAA
ncbi:MAG TPA: hypothetical protein VLG37_03320 [Candidatus Saccharimonadales bacterium]|nr:hypothetical protein [Candidatus Saccharimonadales bacterium]